MSIYIFLFNCKAILHSAFLLKRCLLVFSEKSFFSLLVAFLKISSLWKQSIINTSENPVIIDKYKGDHKMHNSPQNTVTSDVSSSIR